MLTQPMA